MEFLTPHCPEQVDDWSFSLRQDAIETLGDSQKNAAVTEAAIRACREYAWRTNSTTKRTSRANSLPASFARCLSGHDRRPFGHPITFTVALGPHLPQSIAAEPLSINGAGSEITVVIVEPFQLHPACKTV